MDGEETIIRSKFSSGLNIVIRLDNLWRRCHEFKRNGQYAKWNEELDTIWLELARDLFERRDITSESEEFKKAEKIFNGFEEELSKFLPFTDGGLGFKKPDKDLIRRRNAQYKILMKKQLFLARLENYLGKGTTEKESEDDWE
ncbi:MAG: hypothetical protein QXU40_00985 [Candidatus Pacearchaeota archaeon]